MVTSNQTESINRNQGRFLKDMLKFYANFRVTIEIHLKRNYTIPAENTNTKNSCHIRVCKKHEQKH